MANSTAAPSYRGGRFSVREPPARLHSRSGSSFGIQATADRFIDTSRRSVQAFAGPLLEIAVRAALDAQPSELTDNESEEDEAHRIAPHRVHVMKESRDRDRKSFRAGRPSQI